MDGKAYEERLDRLFPAPSPPPTALSPQRIPGCNLESLNAVRHVLVDNHVKYHIFWNDIKFHKWVRGKNILTLSLTISLLSHVTHRALAIYALGGSGSIIEAFYKQDSKVQRAAFASPQPITVENFVEHLNDEKWANAYLKCPDLNVHNWQLLRRVHHVLHQIHRREGRCCYVRRIHIFRRV